MLSKLDVERGFIYKLILIKAKSAKNSENDKNPEKTVYNGLKKAQTAQYGTVR